MVGEFILRKGGGRGGQIRGVRVTLRCESVHRFMLADDIDIRPRSMRIDSVFCLQDMPWKKLDQQIPAKSIPERPPDSIFIADK